uniref:Uncharacterized protein n=1 Tax=Cannabis sativa TaxID=3483 RepID=A0A803QRB8_CANSA
VGSEVPSSNPRSESDSGSRYKSLVLDPGQSVSQSLGPVKISTISKSTISDPNRVLFRVKVLI